MVVNYLVKTITCLAICACFIAPVRAESACTGWIAVESDPTGFCALRLDGKRVAYQTPVTLKNIPCGRHSLEISKPFCSDVRKSVLVTREDITRVQLSMKSAAGSLELISHPAGARIELDGKAKGKTPLYFSQLKSGIHLLRLRLADHRTLTREIRVSTGKKTQLDLKLKPAFGEIQVRVEPEEEVMVLLDDDPVGSPPMSLKRIPSGPHVIKVVGAHYRPFTTTVTVRDGQVSDVVAQLKPHYGTLMLRKLPTGSQIYVDSKATARVLDRNLLAMRLVPGTHRLKVIAPDSAYAPYERLVKINLLEKQSLTPKLQIRTGGLMIDTTPYAATVMVNGKEVGKAPLSIPKLKVGNHTVVVQAKGYASQRRRVQIKDGQVSSLDIRL